MVSTKNQSLRLIIGGDTGNTFEIREGETLTIGRDPGCTIQLTHHSISPIHCRLAFRNGILFITDLDSRVGVYFGNKRRKRIELKDDASFSLGQINIFTSRGPQITAFQDKPRPRRQPARPLVANLVIQRKPPEKAPPGRRFLQSLRRAPFLTLSLILHLVLLYLIYDIPYLSRKVIEARMIIARYILPEDQVQLQEENEKEKQALDEPKIPERAMPLPTPDISGAPEKMLPPLAPPLEEIFIRGLGKGRASRSGLAGEGTARLWGEGVSEEFRRYISDLRAKGMDVVFVFDSTSSMLPFIDEAKRVIDQLVSKLAAVVPNLRMAMITYRDLGDDYVTRHIDLTSDRYEILNFLFDCEAGGGGDLSEAVYEALRRAVETLLWRPEAKRVVVLIGDAPYHEEDSMEMDRLLRKFAGADPSGVVNTVYIGPLSETLNTHQKAAVEGFQHIADLGGGTFTKISNSNTLIEHLVNVAFHVRWKLDLAKILDQVESDRFDRLIERKSQAGDLPWLMEGLKKVPVRSGIVDALIEKAGPSELSQLVSFLESPSLPMETKWAALYILKMRLHDRVGYDPNSDKRYQERAIDKMREILADGLVTSPAPR